MGLFFYTKIGSIISIGDLPTTNIIEPKNSGFTLEFFIFLVIKIKMELLLKIVENFRKFGKIILKELSTNIMLSKNKNVQFLSELFYI